MYRRWTRSAKSVPADLGLGVKSFPGNACLGVANLFVRPLQNEAANLHEVLGTAGHDLVLLDAFLSGSCGLSRRAGGFSDHESCEDGNSHGEQQTRGFIEQTSVHSDLVCVLTNIIARGSHAQNRSRECPPGQETVYSGALSMNEILPLITFAPT